MEPQSFDTNGSCTALIPIAKKTVRCCDADILRMPPSNSAYRRQNTKVEVQALADHDDGLVSIVEGFLKDDGNDWEDGSTARPAGVDASSLPRVGVKISQTAVRVSTVRWRASWSAFLAPFAPEASSG